jgi:rubredoxin
MIPPVVLRLLAESALSHGDGTLMLTARQEVVLPHLHREGFMPLKHRLPQQALQLRRPGLAPNIVSTCPAVGVAGGRAWLREGVFADILAGFSSRPEIPVSISDPAQAQLPASSSTLNFLAGAEEDRWHVQVALDGGAWAVLDGALASDRIPEAVDRLQQVMRRSRGAVAAECLRPMNESIRDLVTKLGYIPAEPLRRYALFSGNFMSIPALAGRCEAGFVHDLCAWAMAHDVSRVGVTQWKTMLVDTLDEERRESLQRMLIHWRAPMDQGPWRAHWLEARGRQGDAMGEQLRAAMNACCPVHTGLSVALVDGGEPAPDAHVVVREERASDLWPRAKRFSFFVRPDFDARAPRLDHWGHGLNAQEVEAALRRVVAAYAAPGPAREACAPAEKRHGATNVPGARVEQPAHRCTACFTQYCEAFGDPLGGIAPGTAFERLPEAWVCPTCGETAAGFAEVAQG